jgi:hypothetical protein
VLDKVLINLLDHNLECLVLVTATVVMEVKVEEFHVFFEIAFIDLADVFLSDSHLSSGLVSKEVDDVNWSVGLNDVVHVDSKGFLCHLGVTRYGNIFKDALLLPKDRN